MLYVNSIPYFPGNNARFFANGMTIFPAYKGKILSNIYEKRKIYSFHEK